MKILAAIILFGASIALPPPPPPRTQAVNISVTAVGPTNQSPYSQELKITVTNSRPIKIAWDPVTNALSYVVYWNTNTEFGEYRWSTNAAGTEITFLAFPAPPYVPYYRYYYAQSSPFVAGQFFDITGVSFLRQTNAGPWPAEFYRVRVLQTTNAALP